MTGQVNNIICAGARVGQVLQGHTVTGNIDMSGAGVTIYPAPGTEPPVSADYVLITEQLLWLTAAVTGGKAAELISGPDLARLRQACGNLVAATDVSP